MMPHIEITKEDAKRVADGGKHCKLIHAGWVCEEDGTYTKPDAFDAIGVCLDDAYKLQTILDRWSEGEL